METARRRELVLENLDCADCAARIEAQVGKLDGVSRASLDFVLKRLTLDLRPGSSPVDVMARTNRIIHDIEPGVVVQDLGRLAATGDSDDGDDAFSRARIVRLAVAVAFYAAALAFAAALPPALGITLYLAAYLLVGADVLIAAGRNILHGRVFDENFLMAVATLGAFAIRAYPEAVAVMLFYQAGEFFEKLAIGHSRRSIDALMDIRPDSANVRRGDVLVKVPPDEVLVGERISVRPGERVPLDGRVREGVSTLDASALTGESLPRGVRPGDEVFAGFVLRLGERAIGYIDSCPHVGWPLAFLGDLYLTRAKDKILCSGHGALFRLEDGVCVVGPCAGDRLADWPVEVVDGTVVTA